MSQGIPNATYRHQADQARVAALVIVTVHTRLPSAAPANPDRWLDDHIDAVTSLVAAGQSRVVSTSGQYVAQALAETGSTITPDTRVDASGLVGRASDGRPLESLLAQPVENYRDAAAVIDTRDEDEIVKAIAKQEEWIKARKAMDLRVSTQITDAGRVATGLEITTRPGVGYTRAARPGCCSRCAVLAGRWYRFSDGFLRHPLCNCQHIPAVRKGADEHLLDPAEHFAALTPQEQDRIYTRAGAEAIRDGADIGQVVNARRGTASGLDTAGGLAKRMVYGRELITTTEGTTKRGIAGKIIRARGRDPKTSPRLMPEDIYEIAGGDREQTLDLLRKNGYLLDRPIPKAPSTPRKPRRPATDPNTVDLDAVAAERAAADAARAAEKQLAEYLAAEAEFNATHIVQSTTLARIAEARRALPTDRAGWDAAPTVTTNRFGDVVPTPELLRNLDTAVDVGRLIERDALATLADDAEYQAAKKVLGPAVAEQKRIRAAGGSFADLAPAAKRAQRANAVVSVRERDAVLRALAEVRSIGGHQQRIRTVDASEVSALSSVATVQPPSAAVIEQFRTAQSYYPTQWLQRADARSPLSLGVADRGFFLENTPRAGLPNDVLVTSASFTDGAQLSRIHLDTFVHEIGHRMEQSIPGLTELEFALVRRRAMTADGALTPAREIRSGEFSYEDAWNRAYLGRTYEDVLPGVTPDRMAHELFQTGVQDVFDRPTDPFGDDESAGLVLGAMALL